MQHSRPSIARMISAVAGMVVLWLPGTSVFGGEVSATDRAFFTDRIEPVLRSRCFSCHSHEAGRMKGGLTLDSRSGWSEGGSHGAAVKPGEPGASLLIKAVGYGDPDLQMPPKKKLPDEEIALLSEWVTRGAPDPRMAGVTPGGDRDVLDWWSLRPLVAPEVPGGFEEANPIDAFVRGKLAGKGLRSAARADRRTLVRRLYFDLHGLPPTPEEADAFVADENPMACERLVDELLNSPRHGERWARHWLDTVHFADTHGCEHDALRPNAWRYRDYVIDSFNRDTRWARFLREQLAADVFYPEEPGLTVAMGFIGAGPFELSRYSTAPVTFAYLDRDDMVTQTMAAFASVTANCARCHDHKSDPITQEDYYSLQAVFAGVGKGDVEYDPDPRVHRVRRRWSRLADAAEKNDVDVLLEPEQAPLIARWEEELVGGGAEWTTLTPETFLSRDGVASLKRLDDGSVLAGGKLPDVEIYTVVAVTTNSTITAIRLEALTDDSLPEKGPGRNANGNFHLSGFEARVFREGASASEALAIKGATSDFDQDGYIVSHAIDGKAGTSWAIHPREGETHQAVFELAEPLALRKPARLTFVLKHEHIPKHLIGRFRLSVTGAPAGRARALPKAAAEGLRIPDAERTREQKTAIARHVLGRLARDELVGLPSPQRVYAAAPAHFVQGKKRVYDGPKKVHVLRRGDIEQPRAEAGPGALAAIGGLPGRFQLDASKGESARRAALADWLAAKDNPLTWRSVVNRVWHHHFGRGICDTPNDFGRMGSEPSHPELLDWLAVWFRDEAKGSLKALHRLILTSETYRQSSMPAEAADLENRWLARMNRRRLDAEQFRDAVRMVSGRLDARMGGPGVEQFSKKKGPQVSPVLDYGAFDWDGPGATRRSVYRIVWRGISDPFMEALDFPDLGLLAPTRGNSVSSLQSLAMFNNDFVLHHSQRMAERIEELCSSRRSSRLNRAEADDEALAAKGKWSEAARSEALQGGVKPPQSMALRAASESEEGEGGAFGRMDVRVAVNLVFQREPTNDELTALTAYAEKHGLAALCRTLLNSNEFLFVD